MRKAHALYAFMCWYNNNYAEAASPPSHRPNPSKDNCQPDSVKDSSKEHENDIDHGSVHDDPTERVDSVNMVQEIEVDDFVLINPNGTGISFYPSYC